MNRCLLLTTLILVLLAVSTSATAAVVTITTADGAGQDGMVYANPGVPFALSPFYSVFALGKTGTIHDTASLAQFDLSSVKASPAQVSKATLTLYTASSKSVNGSNLDPDAGHPLTVDVSPITSTWNRNTVSWGTKPTHGAQDGSFVASGLGQFVSVDVTSYVQNWLANPASNFGFWLEGDAIMGSGPNLDQSPFYAIAFNTGKLGSTDPNFPGLNLNPPTLTLTVPEPTSVVLALCAVPALIWACRGRLRRAA